MADAILSAERLRELLDYNRDSGVFVWNKRTSNRIKVGGVAGNATSSHGYISIFADGKAYLAHRLAWLYVYGTWPKWHIDHLNGNRHDNRIENLRDIPQRINNQNYRNVKSTNKSSGVSGVRRQKGRSKWVARITLNGIDRHIGVFDTIEDAQTAYLQEKRKLHEGCTI